MMLRRLKTEEHPVTRKLWEEVFPEDTKEFLDYYYFIKARTNEIYVIEEDGDIRSMLQLNPYTMQVNDQKFLSNYIIAVATQKEYRGRGYMGSLLKKSMEDMYARKIPFTFLMPAAEAIYTPYDFRFGEDLSFIPNLMRPSLSSFSNTSRLYAHILLFGGKYSTPVFGLIIPYTVSPPT